MYVQILLPQAGGFAQHRVRPQWGRGAAALPGVQCCPQSPQSQCPCPQAGVVRGSGEKGAVEGQTRRKEVVEPRSTGKQRWALT